MKDDGDDRQRDRDEEDELAWWCESKRPLSAIKGAYLLAQALTR